MAHLPLSVTSGGAPLGQPPRAPPLLCWPGSSPVPARGGLVGAWPLAAGAGGLGGSGRLPSGQPASASPSPAQSHPSWGLLGPKTDPRLRSLPASPGPSITRTCSLVAAPLRPPAWDSGDLEALGSIVLRSRERVFGAESAERVWVPGSLCSSPPVVLLRGGCSAGIGCWQPGRQSLLVAPEPGLLHQGGDPCVVWTGGEHRCGKGARSGYGCPGLLQPPRPLGWLMALVPWVTRHRGSGGMGHSPALHTASPPQARQCLAGQ